MLNAFEVVDKQGWFLKKQPEKQSLFIKIITYRKKGS
jgi:hypothetical protein